MRLPRALGAALLALLGVVAAEAAPLRERTMPAPGSARRQATLESRLAGRAQATGPIDAVIVLRRQPDLARWARDAARSGETKAARRRELLEALESFATSRQAGARAELEALRAEGLVASFTPTTIPCGFVVAASPEGLRRVMARPDVADVWLDAAEGIFWEAEDEGSRSPPAPEVAERFLEGPRGIGAPALWARGLDGTGVRFGLIDTGVDAAHEQLSPTWLGGTEGWFDASGASDAPRDPTGHGTTTCSAAAGANVRGIAIGCAPGARWACAAAAPSNTFSIARFVLAADWMLRVGRPDVLLLAMARPPGHCVREFQPLLDAFRAADVVVCVAAGNQGGRAGTDTSPSNLAHLDGRPVLSVGATFRDGLLYPKGAMGPSSCTGRLFPQVVAPGARVAAASSGERSGLVITDGTSLASAFVAGGAALLVQAHPEASAAAIEDAIRSSARDLGPPGPDNMFGFGLVDLPAALAELDASLARRPPPRSRLGR